MNHHPWLAAVLASCGFGCWTANGPQGSSEAADAGSPIPAVQDGGAADSGAPDAGGPTTPAEPASWTSTGGLLQGRSNHQAVVLPDGRVVVLGGERSGVMLDSVEVYDPATQQWAAGPRLLQARSNFTASLLRDGRVLAVGGGRNDANGRPSGADVRHTTEVLNLTDGVVTPGPDLLMPRSHHAAALLQDGRVLITGGATNTRTVNPSYGDVLDSAEVLDPALAGWTAAGTMARARCFFPMVTLQDGRVMVLGGANFRQGSLKTAEIFDPQAGRWTEVPGLTTARYRHTATMLPSGKVLTVGGVGSSGFLDSAEVFDPLANAWLPGPSLPEGPANNVVLVTLPSGAVLRVGGYQYDDQEGSIDVKEAGLWREGEPGWTAIGELGTARWGHTASLLPSGLVLVVGGTRGASLPVSACELSVPAPGT